MCLLNLKDGEIDGWIIATDADDLRRQCEGRLIGGELNDRMRRAAEWLYVNGYGVSRGKHDLPGGFTLLVD